jgi:hypothetical protein
MQVQSHAEHDFIGPLVPRVEPAAARKAGPANQANQATKTNKASKRSMTTLHVGAAFWAVGFVVGFVVWQYVGLWGVIQSVFYPGTGGPERAGLERAGRVESAAVVSGTTQSSGAPLAVGLLSVKLSVDSCTSLILDRTERAIVTAPCGDEMMPLNSLKAARKEDRRISVAEAKAAAATAATPPAPPVAAPVRAKPAPAAPAVASWSTTINPAVPPAR